MMSFWSNWNLVRFLRNSNIFFFAIFGDLNNNWICWKQLNKWPGHGQGRWRNLISRISHHQFTVFIHIMIRDVWPRDPQTAWSSYHSVRMGPRFLNFCWSGPRPKIRAGTGFFIFYGPGPIGFDPLIAGFPTAKRLHACT